MRSLAVAVVALCASYSFGGIRLAREKLVTDATNAVVQEIEAKVSGLISPTDPTFSNAVLAVQISTNDFSALYELKQAFADLPIDPVTGSISIGALLAALASAVAWLKKSKVDRLKVTGMSGEVTAENGVAKLDDFFKDSNSLLGATIEAKVNSMFDNGDTTSYPRPTEG